MGYKQKTIDRIKRQKPSAEVGANMTLYQLYFVESLIDDYNAKRNILNKMITDEEFRNKTVEQFKTNS